MASGGAGEAIGSSPDGTEVGAVQTSQVLVQQEDSTSNNVPPQHDTSRIIDTVCNSPEEQPTSAATPSCVDETACNYISDQPAHSQHQRMDSVQVLHDSHCSPLYIVPEPLQSTVRTQLAPTQKSRPYAIEQDATQRPMSAVPTSIHGISRLEQVAEDHSWGYGIPGPTPAVPMYKQTPVAPLHHPTSHPAPQRPGHDWGPQHPRPHSAPVNLQPHIGLKHPVLPQRPASTSMRRLTRFGSRGCTSSTREFLKRTVAWDDLQARLKLERSSIRRPKYDVFQKHTSPPEPLQHRSLMQKSLWPSFMPHKDFAVTATGVTTMNFSSIRCVTGEELEAPDSPSISQFSPREERVQMTTWKVERVRPPWSP